MNPRLTAFGAWSTLLVLPAVVLLLAAFVFFVLHRAFVGAAYALAWANKWTIEGTDDPVRYVRQIRDAIPDGGEEPSSMMVFLGNLLPVPFGLVVFFLVWTITWAIAFRSRPYAGGVT